jgi:hypothetical protein
MYKAITLTTIILFSFSDCQLNQTNKAEKSKVTYSDRQNKYAKMQLPLEVSWSHDKAGKSGDPISVNIKTVATSDLTNVQIDLTFSPNLKLKDGETTKSISKLNFGEAMELDLNVVPEKTGIYDINLLLHGFLNGERIGTARTIRFETIDYVTAKPEANESGLHIIEGKTDNERK